MKKFWKKCVVLAITLAVLVLVLPTNADAAEVASGTCGDNLTWVLDDAGTLTISGTGEQYNEYDEMTWSSYCDSIKVVVIKDGVTSIDEAAFYYCTSLTSIELPDSLTRIGPYAFHYCENLTSIEIPDSVTSIGGWAFEGCTSLTSVEIPDSVTSIGERAFSSCTSLTGIEVESGNDHYSSADGVLFNKDKTVLIQVPGAISGTYSIPDSVTSIGGYAFYGCTSLIGIEIPDSVTSIGGSAFYKCTSLTSIELPDSVTSIGGSAFDYCTSLTSIEISESVTSIGERAFNCCTSLTSIELPDSVTSIGKYAFYKCTSLTSIELPDSVTSIGKYAFYWCTSLTSIYFQGDAPKISSSAFSKVTATAYYPAGNETWTEDVMQSYGGSITWVAYGDATEETEPEATEPEATEPEATEPEATEPEATGPEAPVVKASNIASSGKIKLTWNAVEGAVKYMVYRSTSKNSGYKRLATTTRTYVNNNSAVAGETYYYYVIAVDADGNQSEKSNVVNRYCDCAQPKITVSNIASTGKIKIKWEAVDGAQKYEVWCATSKDGTYKRLITTEKLYVNHNSGVAGTTYYYKVRAICGVVSATSAYSAVKSATVTAAQKQRIVVRVSLGSQCKPVLRWDAVSGATRYKVYIYSESGELIQTDWVTGTKLTHSSAKRNVTYYYRVQAYSGSSAISIKSPKVFIKSK